MNKNNVIFATSKMATSLISMASLVHRWLLVKVLDNSLDLGLFLK